VEGGRLQAAARSVAGLRAATSSVDALALCAAQVRQYDPPGYACALLLPPQQRRAALALSALNCETARVLDGAGQDAQLQRMRLHWWRDAVGGLLPETAGGSVGGSRASAAAAGGAQPPALAALAGAFPPQSDAAASVRRLLLRLLLAREEDAVLRGAPPPSTEALLLYCRSTGGALLQSLVHSGDEQGAQLEAGLAAAAAVGGGCSLAALLRGSLAHASRGRLYIPVDIAQTEGLTGGAQLLRADGGGDVARGCFRSLAELAEGLLAEGRAARGSLSPLQRRMLLPALPAQRYLDALRASGWDAIALGRGTQWGGAWPGGAPTALHLRLGFAAMTGRF